MYLNHTLVSGFPLTLRYGEERDRDYLADIFAEVWAEIPENDRSAILSRGYGRIVVDVLGRQDLAGVSNTGGDFRLKRRIVDTYPRQALLHLVAHRLAEKLDDFLHPNMVARQNEPHGIARRRIATILQRWGYTSKADKTDYTPADEARIRAILGTSLPAEGNR
jgi:hypothetical protein